MDETSQQAGSQSSAHESTPVFAARDATPAKARYAASSTAPRRAANDEPGAGIAPRNDDAAPTLSIRFAVDPHVTVTWKIASDSTLRVCREQIWLTRTRSTYDYWLGPGDTLRLARGERIWLSSDGHAPAEVTLTSAWSRRRTVALAWIEWFAGWPAMFALRRAR
jgi:hypothetical protein